VTQVAVEAVIAPTSAAVRTTQLVVEAVIAPTSQNLVVSQAGLEVARYGDPFLLVSQAGLEVLWVGTPSLLVSQAGIEVAWELPKGTFTLDAKFLPPPVTMTFGTKSVFYGYSGSPIVIKEPNKGQAQEIVIPGCDLTISGSPITISWDVWQSHFQWAVDKKEIIYIRRDSLTGLVIWSDDPQQNETDAGNNATGMQWHFAGSYTETARSGRYVLTVKPAKGNATLYASEIHFTLSVAGDGPGMTVDAVILRTQVPIFTVAAFKAAAAVGIESGAGATELRSVVKRFDQPGSVDVNATLFIWGLGAFFTNAWVQKPVESSFTAGAQIRSIPEISFPVDAVFGQPGTGSFVAEWAYNSSHFYLDARIFEPLDEGWVEPGDFSVNAVLFRTMTSLGQVWVQSGWADPVLYETTVYISAILGRTSNPTFALDAVLRKDLPWSFGLDAAVLAARPATFAVDAFFSGVSYISAFIVGFACVWTTPGDIETISSTATLAFMTPGMDRAMHFEIDLDQVGSYDGPDLRVIKSHLDQAGWEYWDGGAWQPVPQSGMPSIYAGFEARYTIQVPLADGTWYRRVRAGTI
jgi:hypothetical protein